MELIFEVNRKILVYFNRCRIVLKNTASQQAQCEKFEDTCSVDRMMISLLGKGQSPCHKFSFAAGWKVNH